MINIENRFFKKLFLFLLLITLFYVNFTKMIFASQNISNRVQNIGSRTVYLSSILFFGSFIFYIPTVAGNVENTFEKPNSFQKQVFKTQMTSAVFALIGIIMINYGDNPETLEYNENNTNFDIGSQVNMDLFNFFRLKIKF